MKSLLPPALQAKWDVRDTVPRRERFRELAFSGYNIPRCGEYGVMARLGNPLIVYTDEYAHCGEGKVLWKPGDPVDYPADTFCSEFVGDPDARPAKSHRILIIGYYEVHLKYRSDDHWQSNVGGEFHVYAGPMQWEALRTRCVIPYPMFAVDQVVGDSGENVAVDLNTCPGVPTEVVNMVGREVLTESVAKFCRERGMI